VCRGRQVRDGGAYGCAVPRAYANLNPGLLIGTVSHSRSLANISQTALIVRYVVSNNGVTFTTALRVMQCHWKWHFVVLVIFPVAFCPSGVMRYIQWHFIRAFMYAGILCRDILSGHQLESCGYPIVNKKLSCRRETTRCFVPLNILITQGGSRSVEMTVLSSNFLLVFRWNYAWMSYFWDIQHDRMEWRWNRG